MTKGLFVTATGTDVGKTYVTALMVKKLRQSGLSSAYYKAALSGAESVEASDAGYVKRFAGLDQPDATLLSYRYANPVSPHLAAKLEGNPPELGVIVKDYRAACAMTDYVTVEGSGGIVCPLRWDAEHLLLEDVIRALGLSTVIVSGAELGSINAAVLTAFYMKQRGICVKGIFLNRFVPCALQDDTAAMICELTGLPILDRIAPGQTELTMSAETLASLYE